MTEVTSGTLRSAPFCCARFIVAGRCAI